MKLSYLFVFIGIFFISACGMLPPPAPEPAGERTKSTTSDTDADARGRARIHTDLAVNYLEIRNLGVALEEAGIAQRSDPSYAPAFNVAGLIYIELKDDRMAEESFRQALRINARDADTNNNYGTFLCDRKREADGIKHFLVAISDPLYQFPDRSYVNAGVCARRRGDLAGAENYFRNALKFQPNQIQALYQLADMSYARASYAETRTVLARLVPVAAGSPEILWLMLRTERRLGDGNALDSLAHQLRTNFPDSKEAALLSAKQFD
jgi:type IV pilus assembly protein PilF